jgi:hypothetical protein
MSIRESTAPSMLLLEAAAIAGGIQALARRLRVPSKQLTSWMQGEEQTPHTVFLRVLDFVGARS